MQCSWKNTILSSESDNATEQGRLHAINFGGGVEARICQLPGYSSVSTDRKLIKHLKHLLSPSLFETFWR
jgi:hypothetical protein